MPLLPANTKQKYRSKAFTVRALKKWALIDFHLISESSLYRLTESRAQQHNEKKKLKHVTYTYQ